MKGRFYGYVHTTKFCADFKVLTTLLGSISHSGSGAVKGRLFYFVVPLACLLSMGRKGCVQSLEFLKKS